MSQYRAIRGMADILPEETPLWQMLEQTARDVLMAHGYREIRTPIVESTDLFARSIGEVTDIVEKEMYTFLDRNNESLSLRPEGTASTVRAMVQNGLLNASQRVWYLGPMFRYERPQKGRQRQFHQIGVEAFGIPSPDQDAELLLLSRQWWRRLGIDDVLTLELNSIGSSDARHNYKAALVAYLQQHLDAIDDDSRRRLTTNPLRILDSKDAGTQTVLEGAPSISDFLDDQSKAHRDRLAELLSRASLSFVWNDRLVRGLDYYNDTVFEWTTDQLGAQSTVCGGGRYDGLVQQFGGKATPAAGFAAGLERLILLLQVLELQADELTDLYVVSADETTLSHAMAETDRIRADYPGLSVTQHLGGGSFKSQFKRADKSGAKWALIFGDDEVASGLVTVKPMRSDGEQQTLTASELNKFLSRLEQASEESED
ncbi:MAG: histidine--tRNA ligase [Halieaceae bacterium MED-G27]|nr:histidine--tRNA ligase [Halieaceae bacterium]MAV74495.1 histidine--tRNA ligase [Halieaceae bacterium]OUT64828.1 MAG: histidine--tRNA ligase [Cellvibrionales bacterium TMED21]PDH36088.1 MAG: histidine--tRNA ligase [Halieaceae bacterium MED-G27]